MREINFTSIPLASRPEGKIWQVLTQHAVDGQAILLENDQHHYFVQFPPDEMDPIPFDQLRYDRELGVCDCRRFPER